MKTLVMTAIFVATVVVNAFGVNLSKDFAYNEVMSGKQVASQLVFRKDGNLLQHYLKYNFTYDAEGRTVQKEVLKWNAIERVYERYYCLHYCYSKASVDVEYALWNEKANAYSNVKEKTVYLQHGDFVTCLSYNWSEKESTWKLLVEYNTADKDIQLLAIQ